MVLGRIPSGPTTEEEARTKETDRVTERDHAATVRSVVAAEPARPGILQRLRLLLRRA